jgi:outer membrane protein assembly factor BamB
VFPFIPVAALLTFGANLVWAGEWPGWLGANRDGLSPDKALLKEWPEEGPKLLWKVDTLGEGWSSVAVVDGRIYTTGNRDQKQFLICMDADGQELWRVEQGPEASHHTYKAARSTPTIDGQRAYVTAGNGRVTCHDIADGKLIWERNMETELGGAVGGWRYAESVLILDDLAVVTPGGDNIIVALDKATGEIVWKSDAAVGQATYSSCITIEGEDSTLIVNGTGGGLVAVDAATGKLVWSNPFAEKNANVPTPLYADGHLFWAVGYGKGEICFNVTHAAGKWTFQESWFGKDFNCLLNNYVIVDGRIYGNSRGNKGVLCKDLKTGETCWILSDVPTCQVTWADDRVYVFSDRGRATLVEPLDDEPRITGRVEVTGDGRSWAYPVVIGGRLYLRYDTNLYCYDVRQPATQARQTVAGNGDTPLSFAPARAAGAAK